MRRLSWSALVLVGLACSPMTASPPVPEIVSVVPEGRLALRVSWLAGSGSVRPGRYHVSCAPRVPECSGYITSSAEVRSHVFAGLASGRPYSFVVEAVTDDGASSGPSPPSAPVVPIDATRPEAVVMAEGSALDQGVRVRWYVGGFTGGAPLVGYRVWAESPVGTPVPGSPVELTSDGEEGDFDFLGLTNGRAYTFTVTAVNAAGLESPQKDYLVMVPGIDSGPGPADAGRDAAQRQLFLRIGDN